TGMQETSVLGTGYQQEVHLDRLYADVAVYNEVVTNPTQLPALVDIAIRTAYARKGVAHLTVPNDVQVADASQDPYQHVAPATPPHTAPIYLAPPVRPRDADIAAAAQVLNAGRKPAILVGVGARGAGRLVEQVGLDPARAGTRVPTDVPLVGDVSATLEALLPRLDRRADRSLLERYQDKMHDWNAKLAALESASREPIAPQYLAHQLDRLA